MDSERIHCLATGNNNHISDDPGQDIDAENPVDRV